MKGHRYYILKMNGVCGKILDAEWILWFFGTSHLDVRADKMQNWITQRIWNMSPSTVVDYIKMMWPARKLLREDDPEYWRGFQDGIEAEGAGIWDAIENPVKILRWDNPDMYRGGDENED
jgi:hypothetical protein